MLKATLFSLAAFVLTCGVAEAANCGSPPFYPNSFSANTPAVATQVNANFDALVSCMNNLLAPLASPSFTGSVGIGTTNQTSYTSGNDFVVANATGNGAMTLAGANAGDPSIMFRKVSAPGTTTGYIQYDNTSNWLRFATNGVERVRIDGSGNVGIGTTTPSAKLHVEGSSGGVYQNIDSTDANGFGQLNIYNDQSADLLAGVYGSTKSGTSFGLSNNNLALIGTTALVSTAPANLVIGTFNNAPLEFGTNGSERMRVDTSGRVGIGTTTPGQALQVVGTIRQSGCITATTLSANTSGDIICTPSDARLKNILGPYTAGLDVVSRLSPQRFKFKSTPTDPNEVAEHDGFIAQNVMKAIPDAVAVQNSGYYSLDTTAILAASVNAINELKAIDDRQAMAIDELKRQVAIDDRRLAELETRLAALENSHKVRQAALNSSVSPDKPRRGDAQ